MPLNASIAALQDFQTTHLTRSIYVPRNDHPEPTPRDRKRTRAAREATLARRRAREAKYAASTPIHPR